MDALLADAFDRLLAGCCTPAAVREVERTQSAAALWAELEASGFADAMVAEAAGGAGLGWRDAFELLLACGRHALPLPLGATMLLRAALATAGHDAPPGPLTIAPHGNRHDDGAISCTNVPFGLLTDAVLVVDAQGARLLPVAQAERRATGVHGSLQAHLRWPAAATGGVALLSPRSWRQAGAVLTAAAMAGAMEQVLQATLAYAHERAQFGKSIGKFQAVQQQLSVMAEHVFAARIAAQIGCAVDGVEPHPHRAALAKARAGEAAEKVVAIAHAVHGAIGMTAAYDLQLYTRRLQEWRGDYGGSAYWQARLGAALLAAPRSSTLDFLLAELLPSPPASA
jgi:acyl-CoA dehydrogenase